MLRFPKGVLKVTLVKLLSRVLGPVEIQLTGLSRRLSEEQLAINPEAQALDHTSETGTFDLINDGTHRIHYGFQKEGIRILVLSNMTPGFPYYAAPQKYRVKVFQTRESTLKEPETKIHIIQSPGHKTLYRVFPTGGIKTGNVRPH